MRREGMKRERSQSRSVTRVSEDEIPAFEQGCYRMAIRSLALVLQQKKQRGEEDGYA